MPKESVIKVAIIGTVGVPANYGGFETLAHHLVSVLNQKLDITVYCSQKGYAKNECHKTWNNAKLKYIPLSANGIQSIFYDIWSMLAAINKKNDILLVLGVSGCIALPIIKFFSNKKIVVNIDGLEWRRPKWNFFAKSFLRFSEKIACYYADEIITDNGMLTEYVNIRYNKKSFLIGYGGNHVQIEKPTKRDLFQYPFLKKEYAIKVARIEPENNIELILRAFAKVSDQNLVLIGNWEASAFGKNLKQAYSKYSNIYLLRPIYNAKKLNILRSNAKFYVHGHSAGGTNPSLVEAMCYGLPVLAFNVVYNRVTTNNEAIYFENESELILLLQEINNYYLSRIGLTLKEIGLQKYQWRNIAYKYLSIFELVTNRASQTEQIFDLKSKRAIEVKQLASAYLEHKMYNREKIQQPNKDREIKIKKVS